MITFLLTLFPAFGQSPSVEESESKRATLIRLRCDFVCDNPSVTRDQSGIIYRRDQLRSELVRLERVRAYLEEVETKSEDTVHDVEARLTQRKIEIEVLENSLRDYRELVTQVETFDLELNTLGVYMVPVVPITSWLGLVEVQSSNKPQPPLTHCPAN